MVKWLCEGMDSEWHKAFEQPRVDGKVDGGAFL
jgi:hypothetical protein